MDNAWVAGLSVGAAWAAVVVALVSTVLSARAVRQSQASVERLEGIAEAWTRWYASGWSWSWDSDPRAGRAEKPTVVLSNVGRDDAREVVVHFTAAGRTRDVPLGDINVIARGNIAVPLPDPVFHQPFLLVSVTSVRSAIGDEPITEHALQAL